MFLQVNTWEISTREQFHPLFRECEKDDLVVLPPPSKLKGKMRINDWDDLDPYSQKIICLKSVVNSGATLINNECFPLVLLQTRRWTPPL